MYRVRSYTAAKVNTKARSAFIVLMAISASACSSVSMPRGTDDVRTPTVLTGSVPSATDVAYADIDFYDRAVIAASIDTLSGNDGVLHPLPTDGLPWVNRQSGNSGRISDLESVNLSDTGCLSFNTTANTFAGIKLYAGTACRDITGRFAVTSLFVADA